MFKKSSSVFELSMFSLKWQLSHSSVFEMSGSVMVRKSSSVFEMRWFSLKWQLGHSIVFEMRWFRNYYRTHQFLRRDKGRLDFIF